MSKLFLLPFLLLSISATAQHTLQNYLDTAFKNSAIMFDNHNLAAISNLEQKRLKAAIAGPRAYFSADYLLAPYFNNPAFIDINPSPKAIGYDINNSNGGFYSAMLNVNQPLFTKKIVAPQLQVSAVNKRQYLYKNSLEAHNLTRKITDQYIKVFQDQLLLEASTDLLVLMEDQIKIVTRLVESGILKKSDALLMGLEMQSQQAVLNQLKNQYRQDLADLNILAGTKNSDDKLLEKPIITVGTAHDSSSAFLQQYQLDSLNQQTSVDVFNSAYRPSVNAFANTGMSAVTLQNIQRKVGFSAGLSLTIPLYDGHQKKINQQKSKLALESVSQYKKMKQVEVANNRKKYALAIQSQETNVTLLNAQQRDYSDLLKQYHAQILAGQLSIIDYVNALKQYRQVQQNAINAQSILLATKNAYNYWNW